MFAGERLQNGLRKNYRSTTLAGRVALPNTEN
jgi:hypothetical protein